MNDENIIQKVLKNLNVNPKTFALRATSSLIKERYSSFHSGIGKEFSQNNLSLDDLYNHSLNSNGINQQSGKQEFFENLINRFI